MQNDPQGTSQALVAMHQGTQIISFPPGTPDSEMIAGLGEKLVTVFAQRTNLVNAGQALVGAIEMQASTLPDQVVRAAARMHNLLETVMPGVSLAPRSAEVINDEALHLKAMAEAVARQRKTDNEVEAMVKELPPQLAEIANDLRAGFTTQGAQQEAISDAYERGKADGALKLDETREAQLAEAYERGYAEGTAFGRKESDEYHEGGRERAWNAGYNARVEGQARDLAELSFLGLLRVRAECRRMVKAMKGKVGGIDQTTHSYWRNSAKPWEGLHGETVGIVTSKGFPAFQNDSFDTTADQKREVIGEFHGMPIYANEKDEPPYLVAQNGVKVPTGLGVVNVSLHTEEREQTVDDRLRRDWSPDAGEPKEKLW